MQRIEIWFFCGRQMCLNSMNDIYRRYIQILHRDQHQYYDSLYLSFILFEPQTSSLYCNTIWFFIYICIYHRYSYSPKRSFINHVSIKRIIGVQELIKWKWKMVRNFIIPQNYQSDCGCYYHIQKVKFLIIRLITFHHIPLCHVTQIIRKDKTMLPNFEQKIIENL